MTIEGQGRVRYCVHSLLYITEFLRYYYYDILALLYLFNRCTLNNLEPSYDYYFYLPYLNLILIKGMAQWLSICFPRRPLTGYVLGVICGLSLLLVLFSAPRVFLRLLRYPPFIKTNISKFQFDLDYCQAHYQEPPAREITLHYITLHYITLHYITLHYITLHYQQANR